MYSIFQDSHFKCSAFSLIPVETSLRWRTVHDMIHSQLAGRGVDQVLVSWVRQACTQGYQYLHPIRSCRNSYTASQSIPKFPRSQRQVLQWLAGGRIKSQMLLYLHFLYYRVPAGLMMRLDYKQPVARRCITHNLTRPVFFIYFFTIQKLVHYCTPSCVPCTDLDRFQLAKLHLELYC